jgi:hypothetical protein
MLVISRFCHWVNFDIFFHADPGTWNQPVDIQNAPPGCMLLCRGMPTGHGSSDFRPHNFIITFNFSYLFIGIVFANNFAARLGAILPDAGHNTVPSD